MIIICLYIIYYKIHNKKRKKKRIRNLIKNLIKVFNLPIHKANPAIASTATNTNIEDIINMALLNLHVALPFTRAIDALDQVDLGVK